MTENGAWGWSFILKISFKILHCLEKNKGINSKNFIYKLVNKDILKYKLSKTGVLSDLWECFNTGSPICDFIFLLTWKTNSVLLCK